MIIGHTRDVARFATRDRFAAYCGTAPIAFESGGRSIHRLSLRGNRQMNHAMHIIAVTQIRHRHSPGRGFYDRKLAEGKTPKEALRALKRRITDVVFAQLRAEAARRGPGGQAGATDKSSAADLTPQQPALRKNHSRTTTNATTPRRARHGQRSRSPNALLTTKRRSIGAAPCAALGSAAERVLATLCEPTTLARSMPWRERPGAVPCGSLIVFLRSADERFRGSSSYGQTYGLTLACSRSLAVAGEHVAAVQWRRRTSTALGE